LSDKSVADKLLIKKDSRIKIIGAPDGYVDSLGSTGGAESGESRNLDLIQAFVKSRQELESLLAQLKTEVKPGGIIWITYPKGTSKMNADINRDTIAAYAKTLGLQAVAMISIDDTWSALRLKIVK
jgi:hypothetical protein